jgi:hypothetical protein
MPVNAELRRKNAQGDLVDYVLVDDTENAETALSDPTVDYGARSRLDTVVARLEALAARFDDPLGVVSGLVPTDYDQISLGYTNGVLTSVVYHQSGTLVATLTLTYTGSLLTGVTRT